MKNIIASALTALLFNIALAKADPRHVTLTAVCPEPYSPPCTNTLEIAAYETAELVSFPKVINANGPILWIYKDGEAFQYSVRPPKTGPDGYPNDPFDPLIVTGPARIDLVVYSVKALCTFKLTPESYPPDRSVLVPPGPGGANIQLECSTNLVQWFPATSGAYTNLNEAKFFRIRLDRIQP